MTTYRLDVASEPVGVYDDAYDAVVTGQSLCRPGWMSYHGEIAAKLEGGRHNTGTWIGKHEDGLGSVMVWRIDR